MKICVAGSSKSVKNMRTGFVQKLHKQKHIKAQQKNISEITEMWASRKAFPQELSSNRIFTCLANSIFFSFSCWVAGRRAAAAAIGAVEGVYAWDRAVQVELSPIDGALYLT